MVDFMFHLEILEAIPTYSTTVYLDLLDLVPAVLSKLRLNFCTVAVFCRVSPQSKKCLRLGAGIV